MSTTEQMQDDGYAESAGMLGGGLRARLGGRGWGGPATASAQPMPAPAAMPGEHSEHGRRQRALISIGGELDLGVVGAAAGQASADAVRTELAKWGPRPGLMHPAEDREWVHVAKTRHVAADGTALIRFEQKPNGGRMWHITAVALVAGADGLTTYAASTVTFSIGIPSTGGAGGPISGNLADIVLPGVQGGAKVTVPANAQFNRHQVVCMNPLEPYFYVTGVTPGDPVTAILYGVDAPFESLGHL